MSDVVAGVVWASETHSKEAKEARASGKEYKGAVANMSLGGGKSPALDRSVDGAVEEGIIFAVAAGKSPLRPFTHRHLLLTNLPFHHL
jgi:cerevisin